MGQPVSNTSEGMRSSGAQFVATYNEIDGYMKGLRNELQALSGQWTGEASTVFHNTMDQWGVEFDAILKDLDAMADKLLGGAGHVESAEDFALQQGHFFK
ncbi:WXG100 family type VII secretion target [Allocatelliglobosispora scoriae]|uniref:ESAT-6-like protein n=1 Tax=Allocatelliglobosispora scoriae TaxID=643052 RepID=A0A841C543_9ACTN|nr:WXG100 family type VII secretion target [Allocatelliglobosispora scoriae]MBB5874192.1 WXG100 family type VII secretion target [Allocatelliglobosispora scoriae]